LVVYIIYINDAESNKHPVSEGSLQPVKAFRWHEVFHFLAQFPSPMCYLF